MFLFIVFHSLFIFHGILMQEVYSKREKLLMRAIFPLQIDENAIKPVETKSLRAKNNLRFTEVYVLRSISLRY